MTPLQHLKELYLRENRVKYPSLPECARIAPRYTDKTANGLTKMIIDFLKLKGHQAERVSVTGRYIDQSKVVSDTLGHVRKIGSGKWIKGSMQAGSSDISAVIRGQAVKIEVKIGRDKQSDAQKRYQLEVERAGGIYFIATSFDQFFSWYQSLFSNNEK